MLSISGNICGIVWSMGTKFGHEVLHLAILKVNVSFSDYWEWNPGKLVEARSKHLVGSWPSVWKTQATARRCVSTQNEIGELL